MPTVATRPSRTARPAEPRARRGLVPRSPGALSHKGGGREPVRRSTCCSACYASPRRQSACLRSLRSLHWAPPSPDDGRQLRLACSPYDRTSARSSSAHASSSTVSSAMSRSWGCSAQRRSSAQRCSPATRLGCRRSSSQSAGWRSVEGFECAFQPPAERVVELGLGHPASAGKMKSARLGS